MKTLREKLVYLDLIKTIAREFTKEEFVHLVNLAFTAVKPGNGRIVRAEWDITKHDFVRVIK